MEDYIWPEVTADTSLEEVREIHKRIWDYVIERGKKTWRFGKSQKIRKTNQRHSFKEDIIND